MYVRRLVVSTVTVSYVDLKGLVSEMGVFLELVLVGFLEVQWVLSIPLPHKSFSTLIDYFPRIN